MAKKLLKRRSVAYSEPVSGKCSACKGRVKSPMTIFCKTCGTALMSRQTSAIVTLTWSALVVVGSIILNASVLKMEWSTYSMAIGACAFLIPFQLLALDWRTSNHMTSDIRRLAAAGGAILLVIGIGFIREISMSAPEGWLFTCAGLAVSIGVHYPFGKALPPDSSASSESKT